MLNLGSVSVSKVPELMCRSKIIRFYFLRASSQFSGIIGDSKAELNCELFWFNINLFVTVKNCKWWWEKIMKHLHPKIIVLSFPTHRRYSQQFEQLWCQIEMNPKTNPPFICLIVLLRFALCSVSRLLAREPNVWPFPKSKLFWDG